MTKYKAIGTEVDGITFASKERGYAIQRTKVCRTKKISDLVLQPKFPIEVCGKKNMHLHS